MGDMTNKSCRFTAMCLVLANARLFIILLDLVSKNADCSKNISVANNYDIS